MAFIIWSIASALLILLGYMGKVSKKPFNSWANVDGINLAEELIAEFNKKIGNIWMSHGVLFFIIGIPLLFIEGQNSPLAIPVLLLTPIWAITLMVRIISVENKYKKH